MIGSHSESCGDRLHLTNYVQACEGSVDGECADRRQDKRRVYSFLEVWMLATSD